MLIESPPGFLLELLTFLSQPRQLEEVKTKFIEIDTELLLAVLDDLAAAGLIEDVRDLGRYDRHDLYFRLLSCDYGIVTSHLRNSRVGIVGTGGIGSTTALMLAAAGVGSITISDGDLVEESNLTRSILFDEINIGEKKVEAAKRQIRRKNASVNVNTVDKAIDGVDFVYEHFRGCDILVVSADKPQEVHSWVDEAAQVLKVPYITLGYVEQYGSIGPLLVPGTTGCLNCARLNQQELAMSRTNINLGYQAASYGPLNLLVSAMGANEVIRRLAGLECRTEARQLLIDSVTCKVHEHGFTRNANCACQHRSSRDVPATSEVWPANIFDVLSQEYARSRKSTSLNSILVDKAIIDLVVGKQALKVLDVGCGNGVLAIQLAERGHTVTAIDSSPGMLEQFRLSIPPHLEEQIEIKLEEAETFISSSAYDLIVASLVIDHISQPDVFLQNMAKSLKVGGRLALVIPHPFKDSGFWRKDTGNDKQPYNEFVIRDYFYEGPITKKREDENGNTIVASVHSFKRNVSTYFRYLTDAGLQVIDCSEPTVDRNAKIASEVLLAKATTVPYFMMFVCAPASKYAT